MSENTFAEPDMTHKEILEVLTGLLSMLFVSMISATVVSTALPTIIGDLHGSQTSYTWVVTASLLAMTVTGPIWSKMADLFPKKLLVQLAGLTFLTGSLCAGFSQDVAQLLGSRAIQGIGMGGIIALAQAIMGSIIPPRQRGRYAGYMAAVMAVATVSGPLLGGFLVDSVGWRWCFWVAVPFSAAGVTMIQRFLHLQHVRRPVRIDWLGAVLILVSASLPLVWVSFAGHEFDWISAETAMFLGPALIALVALVHVERTHAEPLVPPAIVAEKTTMLAVVASVAVGIAQFGATVFLSQFFQVAQGFSPTQAGLLMLPLILGSMLGSTVSGQLITRTGYWKRYMVTGTVMLITGLGLMGLTDHTTPVWHLSLFMVLMGLGQGSLMQNLVLVVQNTVDVRDIGAASGVVSFFRSLGGTIGIAVLGAILASRVSEHIANGLRAQGLPVPEGGATAGGNLDLDALPQPVLAIVQEAYADSTGYIFVVAGIITIVTLFALWRMPGAQLRTTVAKHDEEDPLGVSQPVD